VALGYGARREGLSGIILLAAGHTLSPRFQRIVSPGLAKARGMVAAGNGGQVSTFVDFNQGRRPERRITAEIYISWFDLDGPAPMIKNARNLKPGTPVLWINAEGDWVAERDKSSILGALPRNARNKAVVISSTHGQTPRDAAEVVRDWLTNL
jgi:hypothetical protein